MPAAIDTLELSQVNQYQFSNLVDSISQYDYHLSPHDLIELRAFFDKGTDRLKRTVLAENYEDILSYATGQLANKFAFSTPAEMRAFGSFRDFLRSFCPLDPFC